MKNLLNGSRFGIEGTNRIYVQGNFLDWYNADEDILEMGCPLVYKNLDLLSIDQDGIWLEQQTKEDLISDTRWEVIDNSDYLNSEILKKELEV